ncbi:MAG: GAF domain-containing protein [Anaerolineales bacterium]|nr:GAF domain-containing protein [Anaerolineales bacterium]
MDDRFLFPEAHLIRQLVKQIPAGYPLQVEGFIKQFLDSLEDIIVIVDRQSIIHYANPTAIRRFGGIPDQIIGKTLFEMMPFPQVKDRWRILLNALEQHKFFSFVDRGHGKYALTHIFPFPAQDSMQEYFLLFTLEATGQIVASNTNLLSTQTAFEETLRVVRETSTESIASPDFQHHLRTALALANAASGASLAEDLHSALNTLCTQACVALDAPAAVVRLYNSRNETLDFAGSYGLSEEHIRKNFAIPYAPLAYLASTAAPRVFVADLDQSPPTPADQLPYRQQLAASVIANIVRQNRFLGVLIILIPKAHPPLSREDLLFVQAIAEQASISIDRFRLMKIHERRTKELENLVRIGIELREVLSKKDVLVTILNKLANDLDLNLGATYLNEEHRYVLVANIGGGQNLPQWLAIPPNPHWHGGKPLYFTQLSLANDLLFEGFSDPPDSEPIAGLAIPFRTPTSVVGVLLLGFNQPVRLSSDDYHKLYLLQEIGDAALHRSNSLEHLERLVLDRTRELSILYEVTSILNAPTDLRSSIDQVLESVLSILKADFAAIHLYNPGEKGLSMYLYKSAFNFDRLENLASLPEGSPWEIVFSQNDMLVLNTYPQETNNLAHAAETKFTYLGLPIRNKGEILGVLSLFSNHEQTFSLNDQVILTAISDQLGLAIERARLREQGEEIAKLEERQRLARDLHDALTQSLYSMTLLTSGYKRSLHHATTEEILQWMDDLNDVAQNALAELRLLLYELRPTALEQDGLQGALKRRLDAVEKRAGIHTTFEVHGGFRLPPEDEEHFYRIAQEALNNALQHAHHSSILVKIESTPTQFQLSIVDDGIGFDFDRVIQQNHHSGLSNMFGRARQIEARLTIDSTPGKGTKLLITKEYNHV